jgi:hypothetical protein
MVFTEKRHYFRTITERQATQSLRSTFNIKTLDGLLVRRFKTKSKIIIWKGPDSSARA